MLASLTAAVLLVTAAPAVSLASSAAATSPVAAQEKQKRDTKKYNLKKSGLAIDGYDPVAYFKEGGGKAKKGDAKITHTHESVTYRFATKANKEAFVKNPSRYEPLYGGWCAYAMASGDRVEIDPKTFKISDQGLLLFYNGWFGNTLKKWNKEGPDKLRPKADAQWKKWVAKKK